MIPLLAVPAIQKQLARYGEPALRVFALFLLLVVLPWIIWGAGVDHGVNKMKLAAVTQQLTTERLHANQLASLTRDLDALDSKATAAIASAEAAAQTLQQEIARYAQRTGAARACLDADGLRLWRKAIALAHPSTEASGLDAGGVPATPAAGGWPRDHPAAKHRSSDGPLSQLPRPAPGTGGLRPAGEP